MKDKLDKIFNSKSAVYIIIGILSVIWGSSFILIKKGLEGFSAPQVGALRMSFAFIVTIPIALKFVSNVFREHWKIIVPLGFLANMIPAVLFAQAETGLSSAMAGIFNALTPIFTFIIGFLFFKTNFDYRQAIGLFIGFGGSVLLSFINSEGGIGSLNYFVIYVVVATICYGIAGNIIKTYLNGLRPLAITSLVLFSIGPFATVYLFTTDFFQKISNSSVSQSSLFYVFLLGTFGTAFALVLFNKLIKNTSAVVASSVTYLMPVVAVFWGILDGELFFPLHLLGMAFIISGVYLVNRFK